MKILFIGGTGIISSACSALASARGMDLYLLNRGSSFRKAPKTARLINADIRKPDTVRNALDKLDFDKFDAVVDWICFTEDHAKLDVELFSGKTEQFVFISSASAYHTPPPMLPVKESALLYNPHWEYSRNKIACEKIFLDAYMQGILATTIVRPSHTYDKTLLPMEGGYTDVHRMREGKKVIIHGDGTSLWTLTHHRDFAVGLIGLLGNMRALGEAFHITSSEWLSWNQIFDIVARAAGTKAKAVHVPSHKIAGYDAEWGASLLGDKTHSMIFDNSKIKSLVPDFNPAIGFHQGIEEIIAWYDADPARQKINETYNSLVDKIISECS